MIAKARAASQLIDDPAGRLEATAVDSLLDRGAYARHLHQLRKVYLSRRDTLIRALRRHFGADTQIGGESGGLHLVWRFPERPGRASLVAGLARALRDCMSIRLGKMLC
jgi:GntR family transcriptional regulator/MocR family aminotransferase